VQDNVWPGLISIGDPGYVNGIAVLQPSINRVPSTMEAVGLGIGIAGLAGLFSSCLEAIDRIKDYRSFVSDSDALSAQFGAERLRLAQWGRTVGLRDGQLLADHHHCLDDSEIVSQAEQHLTLINNILGLDERRYAVGGVVHEFSNNAARGTVRETTHVRMMGTKLRKLTWALGGKGDRSIQCALLKELVQQLHNLVPPDPGISRAATSNGDPLALRGRDVQGTAHGTGTKWDSWLAECHQMLAKMQGKHVQSMI
jgi:hypothetical protein